MTVKVDDGTGVLDIIKWKNDADDAYVRRDRPAPALPASICLVALCAITTWTVILRLADVLSPAVPCSIGTPVLGRRPAFNALL